MDKEDEDRKAAALQSSKAPPQIVVQSGHLLL
jgi:hypothetical protein